MKRFAALPMLLLLAGCQSQTPSLDSVNWLAPYGTTRVPPPSTGSYGKPNTYYQPQSQASASVNSTSDEPIGTGVLASNNASAQQPTPARRDTDESTDRVALTSAQSDTRRNESESVRLASAERLDSDEPPVRIVESTGASSSSASRLKGMRVNDVTRPAEPERFEPSGQLVDISQLPRPTRPVRPAPASANGSASGSTSVSSGANWQSRDDSSN
jgi:hypothetical protein